MDVENQTPQIPLVYNFSFRYNIVVGRMGECKYKYVNFGLRGVFYKTTVFIFFIILLT